MPAISTSTIPTSPRASSWRLVNADLHVTSMLGETPDEAQLKRSAANAVRTFLRAYRRRPEPVAAAIAATNRLPSA